MQLFPYVFRHKGKSSTHCIHTLTADNKFGECMLRSPGYFHFSRMLVLRKHAKFMVASGPGISGNLEKSENFAALEKCQGKIREFCEI